jgi:hypothetical protein
MHCALEGTVKKLLELWFKSSNHKYQFYLNSKIKYIDKLLLKIQYPSELPRNQRSIINYKLFKANECRNLIYYCFIYILKDSMPQDYYEHLINYILFIRILTKDYIDENDINNSKALINKFVTDFNKLYGTTHLSYNLHSHLHLPDQVKIYGPLNKLSCFAFEGVFKICLDLFFGTVNIAHQIATNLNLKSHVMRDFNPYNIINNNLRQFLLDLKKTTSKQNKILYSQKIFKNNLTPNDIHLLNLKVNFNNENIIIGNRAVINGRKYSTRLNNKSLKNQNFTIRYLKDSKYKYGIIHRYYQINDQIYTFVQNFKQSKHFVTDSLIENELNNYFLICKLTSDYEIIDSKNIDNKCVILKNEDEYFISVCNLLNEHD